MRQQSIKVYVLKTDPEQYWFSKSEALAAGYKAKELERFDSRKEFERYRELLLLERAGEIRELICHPLFRLSDKFTTSYSPDFTYLRQTEEDNNRIRLLSMPRYLLRDDRVWEQIAEDVKGVSRKKTAKGFVPCHLLRREHQHIFERFQERYPQYSFELYPPLY